MADSSKLTSSNASIKSLYQVFGENTTMHGVGRTVIRGQPRRLFWLFMVLASAAWALFQFVNILKDFYSYPVRSAISLRHESSMLLPMITICNINRIKRSFLTDTLAEKVKSFINQKDLSEFAIHSYTNQLLREIDADDADEIWQTCQNMLIDCSFHAKKCDCRSFQRFYDSKFGNCFMFGPENNTVTKAGPLYGLILELNVQQEDYIPLTSTAGFKVIIHNFYEPPFPEDTGILVRPGDVTSIALKKTISRRLAPPYGSCVSQEDAMKLERNLYAEWGYDYTESGCRKSCLQLMLYKSCNCCDFDIPCNPEILLKMAEEVATESTIIQFCDSEEQEACATQQDRLFMNESLKCTKDECPPPCDQIFYETLISTAYWPADSIIDLLLKKVGNMTLPDTISNSSDELKLFIRKNFLRLEIYYGTLESEELDIVPLYDWSKAMSEIGGQLGLWLGFSVLTGLELVELLLDTAVFCVRELLRKLDARVVRT